MADKCNNCGAELFEGQQFCRACGAPTRQFSGEDLPTQMLPGQQQPPQATVPDPLSTAPLSGGRDTSDPVYATNFPRYQPPPVPQQRPTSPGGIQPPPPSRRRSRVWVYVVLALLVFFGGASLLGGLFFAKRTPQRFVKVNARPHVGVPPMPPPHPQHPRDRDAGEGALVGDEGAEVSANQTIITKTYPLAPGGSFELRNINGDIRIEGWDEQQAEVKIIKRGGSPEARDALKIVREQSGNRLAISTTPEMRAGGVEEVRYEVKLPRNLRELEIISNNSNVELADTNDASVSVVVQRGNIGLEDVNGMVNTRTMKGNTKVLIGEGARIAPQVFNGINGNIELELAPDVNAEVKAETVSGNIDIDEEFDIKVEKRMVGQQAAGRIGKGGQPIVIKNVSGNIKIKS
ncbi:MAG TPA: DUF4097 family beta strand repeat-containing protein [Pyrinomonadaceae bacterium]|nr:DUF4097 family beta strand repeat-containing protein [Pyrinomonadaceae bacterium]